MKRFVSSALLAALLGASTLLAGCTDTNSKPAAQAAEAKPAASAAVQEQIKRGQYLAAAADCAACHTVKGGGGAWAGGAPLHTPFGTIYGTNISPDKQYGIGNWAAEEFYTALHSGRSPGLHFLYPAMPYTSYQLLTRADTDAIYTYLMHQKPAAVANRPSDMHFPFNMRFGLMFWQALFSSEQKMSASEGTSLQWARGRYLTNAVGHCGECHTPRGMLGQLKLDKPLSGNLLGRVAAPDITPQGLAARGWTGADMQTFLKTGIALQGSAYDEMHTVVKLSTSKMSDADIAAMTTYLMGDRPLSPQLAKPVSADAAKLDAGRRIYTNVCAGCHGLEGNGKPGTAIGMNANSTVRLADPHNLLVSILDGLPEQVFTGTNRMQAMPGFADRLNDTEVAALSNYLRAAWGGQAANVTAHDVAALRGKVH